MPRVDAELISKFLAATLRSTPFLEKLAEIWIEKGDSEVSYPLEVFETSRYFPDVWPSGEVSLSGQSRQNPMEQSIDSVYDFDVYWHTQGNDIDRLQAELSRYVRAVEDFFVERPDHLHQYGGAQVWTGDADYSPLTRFAENQPFVRSAVIKVFVRAQR